MDRLCVDILCPTNSKRDKNKDLCIDNLGHIMLEKKPNCENNIELIQKKRYDKKKFIKTSYDKIFTMCNSQIKRAIVNNKQDIVFEIPIKLKLNKYYNHQECTLYIAKKLMDNGYRILTLDDCRIFITWANVTFDKQKQK